MHTVLGLLELVVYVVGVLALSMALTWLVVKISPSESTKEQQAKAEPKT
jgi:flagellar biogenesis protein FliO